MKKTLNHIRRKNGFTLIELVMVIVILGVLAAVALPKFVDLSSEATQARAKNLAGTIASASAINYSQMQLSRQAKLNLTGFFQAGQGTRSLDADVSSMMDGWSDDGDPKGQLSLEDPGACNNSSAIIPIIDNETRQTLAFAKVYCYNPSE